jgi:VWFA-related protein
MINNMSSVNPGSRKARKTDAASSAPRNKSADSLTDSRRASAPFALRRIAIIGAVAIAAAGVVLAWQAPASSAQQNQAGGDEPVIRVNVDLVNIFFNVKTKKGNQLVPNLNKENFKIYEDGKEQTIKTFARESDLPLTLGLLIDISASKENLIEIERQAASQFFSSVIRPKDEAFLISFGKTTDLLQDYTSSPRLLSAALKDLRGDGQAPMIAGSPVPVNTGPIGGSLGTPKGTLLFDAVYLASNEKLQREVGRKAMVLITDGEDQGSTYRIHDAIEAAQKADAIIYSIYYVDRAFYAHYGMGAGGGEGDLRKMSEQTGGQVFKVDSKHPLSKVFEDIQEQLRNQYSISYTPTNSTRDGSFRRIQIKVDSPDDRVLARDGYYATKNDAE